MAALLSSSSPSAKVCFNSSCNAVLKLAARKGWRRRTGEFADLCHRCGSAYEDEKFCETFHMDASGWRNCERCKKSIHCGCIVSFHMFVLLDAGGIECLTCARRSFILTPNPAWPPPSRLIPQGSERLNDLSVKNWNPIAGSGPVPWQQSPSLFHASLAQSKLPQRTVFQVEMPGGFDQFRSCGKFNLSLLDKKKNDDSSERLMNGGLKIGAPEILGSGATGIKYNGQPKPFLNIFQQSAFLKDEHTNPHFSLPVNSGFKNEGTSQTQDLGVNVQRSSPPNHAVKQLNNTNGTKPSVEAHTRNERPRAEIRGKNQPLPRYWPRITDQELQQISGDSNHKVTPLFEKVLSASDAGRIGRLVLPKKCAEAHLPVISQPEGMPLKVQDVKGNEWVFQFRFWPNNNSRMYVLEGVTPCIQLLQLQAGDKVTFSRIEPEGKLILGYRKTLTASPSDQEQVNKTISTTNGVLINGDVTSRSAGGEAAFFSKRKKNSTMTLKCKRSRHENDEMIELNISWGHAQDLFRPPPDISPTVMVIEGVEFEEYEQEAPIIGRPTILATSSAGENMQWVQCEHCSKWRKIPADALLPSRWTCSKNHWDPERSLCSADEELTSEELDIMFPRSCWAASKSKKADKVEPDANEDFLEGLDGLADLAIQEDGEAASSSQATTRHPRHRPGCTCIVCIQPPSGKGPKHEPSCMCPVCMTIKRRFNTLMLRREQKQSEKAEKKLPDDNDVAILSAEDGNNSPNRKVGSNEGSDMESNKKQKMSSSPLKSQVFDLNTQPEREEELSPGSESIHRMRLVQKVAEKYYRKQKVSESSVNVNSVSNQAHMDAIKGLNFSNGISLESNHQNTDTLTER